MEEDIKILEEMKKDIVYDSDEDYDNQIAIRQIQAIENIIKGYRELEKDLHEMTISNNHKKENWIHKNCLNEYIPKSKIKENIKEIDQLIEYEKQYGNVANRERLEFKKEVLQELLEEKE